MAAGPAGKVVGKAVVKVVPDTSDAYDEVRDLVKRLERDGVRIKVEVDTRRAERDAKGLVDDIGAARATVNVDADTRRATSAAKVAVDGIDKLSAKVDVDLDDTALRTKRAQIVVDLAALRAEQAAPKVDLDTTAADTKRRALLVELASLGAQRASPTVEVSSVAEARFAAIQDELAKLDAARADPKVDADIAALEADLARVDAEIAAIDRRRAVVTVDLDEGGALVQGAEVAAAIGSLSPTMGVDLDTGLATAQAVAFAAAVGSLRPTIGIGADTGAAAAKAAALPAMFAAVRPEITVDADTGPAGTKALDMSGYIRSLDPQMRVGADTGPAGTKALDMERYIAGLSPELKVGADTTPARTKALDMKAYIDSLEAKIKVTADVDKKGVAGIGDGIDSGGGGGGFGVLAGALGAVFKAGSKLPSLFGGISGALATSIETGTKVSGTFTEMGTAIFGAGSKAASVAGPIGAAVGVVLSLVGTLVGFGAQLAQIAVIAGAVTFAVGALGAAVSSLPALLFGAGLAAASVYLGFDGIKKAASAAAPALDALKKSISDTFVKTLTPFFTETAQALPKLDAGLKLVASSVSGLVGSLLGVAFGTEGFQLLQAALANTQVFVAALTPGFVTLFDTMLRVSTIQAPFRILGELISGVSVIVAGLFARFAEGGESSLMVRSLEQLKNVVLAASAVFGELVLGATEFFTAAGPGVTSALESIGRVIQKIDFKSLGESFGKFVDTAAGFIDRVPQSTWDSLAESIKKLADEFVKLGNNPDVQTFFNFMIESIPVVISVFATLVAGISTSASIVVFQLRTIGAVASVSFAALQTAALTCASIAIGALASIVGGINSLVQNIPFIPQSWKDGLSEASTALDGWKVDVDTKLGEVTASVQGKAGEAGAAGGEFGKGIADGAKAGIAPMPGAMGQSATLGVGGINAQVGPGGAAGTALGAGAAGGATTGIAPMPGALGDAAKGGVTGVNGQVGPGTTAGTQLGAGAAGGAKTGIAPMPGDMTRTTQDAQRGIGDQEPGFRTVGERIIDGLASAIRNGAASVIEAAINIAKSAIQAAKNALGIASPSRVFRYEIGAQIPAGWVRGINAGAPQVERAVSTLADTTTRLAAGTAVRPFYRAGLSYGEQIAAGVTQGVQAVDPAAVLEQRARVAGLVGAQAAAGPARPAPTGGQTGQRSPEDDDALVETLVRGLEGARLRMHPDNTVTIARQAKRGDHVLARR